VFILRILLIGTNKIGGGYDRIIAFYDFLSSLGYDVSVFNIPGNDLMNKIWYYYHSILHHTIKDYIYLVKKIGDRLEYIINRDKYDVVICVETLFSHVLTRDLGCLKLFSCESLESDEKKYSGKYDSEEVEKIRKIENEIFDSSDYVIFPWENTEYYTRKYFYDDKKLMTIKYGCYPKDNEPNYYYPCSIISLGNLRLYWSNKELLSYLTKISPYNIDIYGKHKPAEKYDLNYKGFAKSLDIIYDYQFGINTVTKDIYRKNHFSSRIINYLAHGLPVLFPEWQEFPKKLKGCIAFNEDNFVDRVGIYSDEDKWYKLRAESKQQGRELDWNITLRPLDKLIKGG
jgi:hypothetical protein